jgi:hypothetical protein
MEIECPRCKNKEDRVGDLDWNDYFYCKKCNGLINLKTFQPSETLPHVLLKHWCETCKKNYLIEPQDSNHMLYCICGNEILIVGSHLYCLRSIRRIALYFLWLSIIGTILSILISLAY